METKEPKLSNKELQDTLTQGWDLMFSQARILAMLPLEDWLAAMSSADTLGPILDPTLWIAGHNKMGIIREMIEACLVVKRKLLELQQKVGKPDGL